MSLLFMLEHSLLSLSLSSLMLSKQFVVVLGTILS